MDVVGPNPGLADVVGTELLDLDVEDGLGNDAEVVERRFIEGELIADPDLIALEIDLRAQLFSIVASPTNAIDLRQENGASQRDHGQRAIAKLDRFPAIEVIDTHPEATFGNPERLAPGNDQVLPAAPARERARQEKWPNEVRPFAQTLADAGTPPASARR